MRFAVLALLSACWVNEPAVNEPQAPAPVARRTVRSGHSAAEPITDPATVEGSFSDLQTGGPGYGIQISLRSRATHRTYTTDTDRNGYYVFLRVEPGEYVLEWELARPPVQQRIGPGPLVMMQHQTIIHVGEGADIRYDVTTDLSPPTTILVP